MLSDALFCKWYLSYHAGQKKRNSQLRFLVTPLKEGTQLLTQSSILEAINSQPPSKLIYLFQGAHKKIMNQICVSFDQHCNLSRKKERLISVFRPICAFTNNSIYVSSRLCQANCYFFFKLKVIFT